MKAELIRKEVIHSLREGVEVRLQLIEQCMDAIIHAADMIQECFQRGGKVLLFGNGGSAADAQHIAAEFVGRFAQDRNPWPALSLATDTSALTAIGNDYGFERVFARQLQALGQPNDVVIAISTSGRSPNVIAATEVARARALKTIAFTGGNGGQLATLVDIPIIVPSVNTARIQECHITIGHILCEIVESSLMAEQSARDASRRPAIPQGITGNNKLVDWDTLLRTRKQWRAEGKTVVWTNGCFDLLHIGHVRGLEAARSLGDILVVGVNSDDSVRQLKGSGRPIMPASERVQVIAALACVDYVVTFNELTPEAALTRLKPDVHCKGADYAPPKGKAIPETRVVESYGGRIEFFPIVPSTSTSNLIQRIRDQSDAEHESKV